MSSEKGVDVKIGAEEECMVGPREVKDPETNPIRTEVDPEVDNFMVV